VQTCSICHAQSQDNAAYCSNCQADLKEHSNTAVALKRIQDNDRITSVRISVAHDCCPACRQAEGSYAKNNVPHLPIEGCSHEHGCRCYYKPVLGVLYP
jgi:hypothetical protein